MSSRELTDSRKLYVLIRDAGNRGVHSYETRHITMNVSQRAKDIVSHGVAVSTRREAVGRRPGSRYWLAEHAPSDAVAVRANGASETHGEPSIQSSRDDGEAVAPRGEAPRQLQSITPAPEQVAIREPVAIVRDGDSFAEVPIDARPCRRCESTGQLAGGECPACFGTGVIARTRVNSYVQAEAA